MIQADFFIEIQKHWKKELPFVVYNKPNSTQLKAQLQQSVCLETPNFDKEGFLFAPFSQKKHQSIWFSLDSAKELNAVLELKEEIKKGEGISTVLDAETERIHVEKVAQAVAILKLKKLQKVVLSRKETQPIDPIEPLQYFKNICESYPNTFCYCWYHPKVGMWLGATPETLIQFEKNNFETMALAGTMPFENTVEVTWGEKEKEEQQYVVDSIVSELEKVTSTLSIGATKTQKAGSLLHLKTPISGTLNSIDSIQILIKVLHPTPAVCGLPKKASKNYILENENYDRKYYTGFLGNIDPKRNSHLFVNLRCMELEGSKAHIYVGGGITELSDPQKEWVETTNKSQIMKRIL